jgi:hypothetical protein
VELSRITSRVDRLLVELGERSARRMWPAFPYTIRLDHPPTADPSPRYGFGRPSHARLESILDGTAGRLRSEMESFQAYFDDLALFSLDDERSPEPCWIHPWLIGLDTVSLYCYVRRRAPAHYVEVGSGQSTKVVARARRDAGIPTTITSIDPRPRSEVDGLCDIAVRLPLEKVDVEATFGGIGAGDVIFFDGSHRVLPNSDCVAFFLDVLPGLPPGVLVGIHDVYLPDDYPQGFLEMWWSEQYLLAALLLGGSSWLEVVLPAFYASGRPELAASLDALFCRPHLRNVNRRGSVFWLETKEAGSA